MEFIGAKLALFLGSDLLVIRRDNKPDIPFPDHWDLPGGGREGDETAVECVLRETREEVGLCLTESELIWSRRYGQNWFFVAHRPAADVGLVRFGSEGQGWRTMVPGDYLDHPMAIPNFTSRLRDYLSEVHST